MYAGIAAGDFGSFQVQRGQFPSSGERLTVRNNFGNHSPVVRGASRDRLGVEQERLGAARTGAITPGGEDSVAGSNALREVGHILESRALCRHNYTGE